MPMPATRAEFDRFHIKRAVYFTHCRFLGCGRYDTRKEPTLEAAAEAAAKIGKRAMIYAVTPEGWTIHVCNWLPPKERR